MDRILTSKLWRIDANRSFTHPYIYNGDAILGWQSHLACCVPACLRACVPACPVYLRAYVPVCLHACVRVCLMISEMLWSYNVASVPVCLRI